MQFLKTILWAALLVPAVDASAFQASPTGQIEFQQIGANQLEAGVQIFFEGTPNIYQGLTDVELCWGDGECDLIPAINGTDINGDNVPDGEQITDDFVKKIYQGTHIYADTGTYTLSFRYSSRKDGILNLNFPNSITVPYFIGALARVTDQSQPNRSPRWLEPPIDRAQLGAPFVDIPNAYDPDGDSLVYEWIIPQQDQGVPVPNYQYPDGVMPGPDNILNLADYSYLWNAAPLEGDYSLAILVRSYRNGELWEESIRDLLIPVIDEDNEAPVIDLVAIDEMPICVEVGDTVSFSYTFSDVDAGDLTATITSGLLEGFNNPAIATIDVNGSTGTGAFYWEVGTEHVRDQWYPVVLKVRDEFGIADKRLLLYKVLDPATGIAEVPPLEGLLLYPNPARTNIRLTVPEPGLFSYQLFDAVGRSRLAGQMEGQIEIDLQQLPAGSYFIEVEGERGRAVTAFQKL